MKEASNQKSLENRPPLKCQKLGVSKGGVEKILAFKELSMKSYGKLLILTSTGLWIEDHECRIICLG